MKKSPAAAEVAAHAEPDVSTRAMTKRSASPKPAKPASSGTRAAESAATGLAFQFAIEKARSINPEKVRNALAKLRTLTFYGLIRFNSTGANTYKPMATVQIQKGTLVTVFPRTIANKKMIYPTPAFGSR